MLKWEYRTVDAFTKDSIGGGSQPTTYYVEWNNVVFNVDDFLDLFGNDGWELAAVHPALSRILEQDDEHPELIVPILNTYHFKRMREE